MEQVNIMLEPVRVFMIQLGEFLPKLIVAIAILVAGWLFAKVIRFAVVKALRVINFQVLTERAGVDGFLRQGGAKTDTVDILGLLIYWLVILVALVVAFNGLGLAHVTDLLGKITLFVPNVIVAVLVLAFGAYFARFIDATVTTFGKNVELQDAELLGRLARFATLIFVVLIALDQISIGVDIVRQSFLILLAGVALALAIAFGIGGQKWAAGLLERWWPNRNDSGHG